MKFIKIFFIFLIQLIIVDNIFVAINNSLSINPEDNLLIVFDKNSSITTFTKYEIIRTKNYSIALIKKAPSKNMLISKSSIPIKINDESVLCYIENSISNKIKISVFNKRTIQQNENLCEQQENIIPSDDYKKINTTLINRVIEALNKILTSKKRKLDEDVDLTRNLIENNHFNKKQKTDSESLIKSKKRPAKLNIKKVDPVETFNKSLIISPTDLYKYVCNDDLLDFLCRIEPMLENELSYESINDNYSNDFKIHLFASKKNLWLQDIKGFFRNNIVQIYYSQDAKDTTMNLLFQKNKDPKVVSNYL